MMSPMKNTKKLRTEIDKEDKYWYRRKILPEKRKIEEENISFIGVKEEIMGKNRQKTMETKYRNWRKRQTGKDESDEKEKAW